MSSKKPTSKKNKKSDKVNVNIMTKDGNKRSFVIGKKILNSVVVVGAILLGAAVGIAIKK